MCYYYLSYSQETSIYKFMVGFIYHGKGAQLNRNVKNVIMQQHNARTLAREYANNHTISDVEKYVNLTSNAETYTIRLTNALCDFIDERRAARLNYIEEEKKVN
jgi:hypothetical protein